MDRSTMHDRAERYLPQGPVSVTFDPAGLSTGELANISRSGLACTFPRYVPHLTPGMPVSAVQVTHDGGCISLGRGRIARLARGASGAPGSMTVGIAFETDRADDLACLFPLLAPYRYVTNELVADVPEFLLHRLPENDGEPESPTLDQFYRKDGCDVLAKCGGLHGWSEDLRARQIYQRLYRVTVTGALDNCITIFDPVRRSERVMRCFDSNSYLGLHRHPRVNAEVERVLRRVGYGTPSAQVLCGTNRYLRELEDKLSQIHGREETMVFPTGYATNTGTIGALIRDRDAVICDRHAHASIQDGCAASSALVYSRFRHNDVEDLDAALARADEAGAQGKLVITDGVFSMHGDIAPLPELIATCRRHGARIMVDDAHGLGVIGATGYGVEEHFNLQGQVDVLMGTLSKSVGSMGGYVSGDRELITYLRWFAASGLFTTSLPAALCAGMREALCVMEDEPEHRAAMLDNARYFSNALRQLGFDTNDVETPIVTIHVGPQRLLWRMSTDLFDAGVKCGSVIYPAVPKNHTILRFVVNARHTRFDLDFALDALERVGRSLGMLDTQPEQLQAQWH